MSVYKIQIAPGLSQKMKLQKLTYANEQEAIKYLTKTFEQNQIEFRIAKKENKKCFLNESGGELAAVVPVR